VYLRGGPLLSAISNGIVSCCASTAVAVRSRPRLTDRRVLAFLSQAHVEPDITLEMFYIDYAPDRVGGLA
jgi:hypothetical protein